MDPVSIVGAALSAIGAGVSIWQAKKVKTYRDEIVQDRQRLSLIEASETARRAREECRKITTPAGKPIRGIDSQKVIDAIRDCADRLGDNKHRLGQVSLHPKVSELQEKIRRYVQETDELKRFQCADVMYEVLGDIVGIIAQGMDESI